MRKSFINGFILTLLFSTILLFAACKKERKTSIPYTKVDVYIYPSQPLYNKLNMIGGWAYVSGGYKGIIVYRKDLDTFNAYERACTFDPEESCSLVEVTADNLTCVDSCCNSKFRLVDGSILASPATVGLLQYQTTWDGTVLHIIN